MERIKNRLRLKIEECERLYSKLRMRPFEVKASGSLVNVENHPELTNVITEKLKNKERFLAKVLVGSEDLWCIVIGRVDSHNANFDDSEEGQIFVGVLNSEPSAKDLHFNDLIEFQSCDVFQITSIKVPLHKQRPPKRATYLIR